MPRALPPRVTCDAGLGLKILSPRINSYAQSKQVRVPMTLTQVKRQEEEEAATPKSHLCADPATVVLRLLLRGVVYSSKRGTTTPLVET
jgi:hypothetical protein